MAKHLLFLMILISFSCGTPQKAIHKSSVQQIEFGNGGGVVGQESSYTLTSDAKLYQDQQEIKTIDEKLTLKLFQKAQQFTDYKFQNPSNIYSYIRIKTVETENHIIWTPKNPELDKNVADLYNQLFSLTQP